MKMLFFEIDEKQKQYFEKAFPHDELYFFSYPLTYETIPSCHSDAVVISIFVHSRLTKKILDYFPQVALVLTRTTGFDHIDCVALKEKKICLYALPTYATQAVAEYTFALLLALMRKVVTATNYKKEEISYDFLRGFELAQKTIGIIGLGAIGTAVARIALGFSMKVIAHDPCCTTSELPVSFVSLCELIERSDVISLHVPYNKSTHHLLNKNVMSYLKKGSYLVNTSRGAVIDTIALLDVLENTMLAGVALDVMEEEFFIRHPAALVHSSKVNEETYKIIIANNYLMQHPHVIISPHNAFNSQEALDRSMQETKEGIEAWKKQYERL